VKPADPCDAGIIPDHGDHAPLIELEVR